MVQYDIEGNPISSDAVYAGVSSGSIDPSTGAAYTDSGGGTSLNELGTFFRDLGTGVSSVINATHTPQPVTLPRYNTPFSSATQGVLGASTTNILTLVIFGVLLFFGIKAIKKA